MKLLVVAVFLAAVVLSVKAMPAEQYPEQEEGESAYVPHVVEDIHLAPVPNVLVEHPHDTPLLTYLVNKVAHGVAYVAPHVLAGVGAFFRSSAGYDHDH